MEIMIYTMAVDVARGINNDYSAVIVFDVTKAPYRIVAKYRNNDIKPIVFPNILKKLGDHYNKAFCLIRLIESCVNTIQMNNEMRR